jgi:hypothetical protein
VNATGTRGVALALLVGCIAAATGGCGSDGRSTSDWTPSREATERAGARIDATPGRSLILPLGPETGRLSIRRVALADGRQVPVGLWRITRSGVDADAAVAGWIGSAGRWEALREEASSPPAPGGSIRVAIIDIPKDAAGATLWIDGRATPVNWLSDPDRVLEPRPEFWPPLMPDHGRENQYLRALLRDAATSPLDRWRVRLLLDGLRGEEGPIPFDDPVIEALAQQAERRWRLAFARIGAQDRRLVGELKYRLCAVMDFGEGVVAPAWASDEASLERVQADALDARRDEATVVDRVRAWLEEQPQGAVWVHDDGGLLNLEGRPVPCIGVANLSPKPVPAWSWLGTEEPPAPDLHALAPWSSMMLVPPEVPGSPAAAAGSVRAVQVHLGPFVAQVPVAGEAERVLPPGASAATFFPDLTLRSWYYAMPDVVPETWGTSARLYRTPMTPERAAAGLSPWELYVQCSLVPGAGVVRKECVTVVMGPQASPRLVLRVGAGSETVRVGADGVEAAWEHPVVVVKRDSGWAFTAPVPLGATERTGAALHLGLARTDAIGRRSAWPRPILPWRRLPSGRALDLRAWTKVE